MPMLIGVSGDQAHQEADRSQRWLRAIMQTMGSPRLGETRHYPPPASASPPAPGGPGRTPHVDQRHPPPYRLHLLHTVPMAAAWRRLRLRNCRVHVRHRPGEAALQPGGTGGVFQITCDDVPGGTASAMAASLMPAIAEQRVRDWPRSGAPAGHIDGHGAPSSVRLDDIRRVRARQGCAASRRSCRPRLIAPARKRAGRLSSRGHRGALVGWNWYRRCAPRQRS